MSIQSNIRQFPTDGFVGDFALSGPIRSRSVVLKTTDPTQNIIGRAVTLISGQDNNATVGGTGAFVGILSNSKQYALLGGVAPLAPTMALQNEMPVQVTNLVSGMYVTLSTTANIGDGVAFNTTTGILAAAPGGTAPSGHTTIQGASVIRRNITTAGTMAIIQILNGSAQTFNPVTQTPPSTNSAPSINGTPTVGTQSTATAGSFSGNPTPTVVRSWLVDGTVVATAANYTPVAGDAGKALTVREVASNGVGSPATATSAPATIASSGGSARTFTTTDSYNSGEQVVYAGGIYNFTTAHAPGDWTGNDVTYVSQVPGKALNKIGVSKPFGVVADWTNGAIVTAATTTPATSRGMKQQMEGPFTRLKVQLFNREAWPTRGFSMSVASTEQPAIGSINNAVSPIVNGTVYNVLRATSQYGYDILNFDGSTRSPVLAPGGVSSPGQGYVTNLSIATSGWSNTASVPPLTAGNREMLVALFNRIANVGDASSNVRAGSMFGNYNRYAANDPRGRLMYCPSVGNGDQVADPTLSRSAAGTLYDPTTGGVWQNIAFIAEHLSPTRNMYQFGDSITEGYSGGCQDVIATISTRAAPFYSTNFGCSTNRSAQYLALYDTVINQENYATDVIFPTFSPNEVQAMTDALADGFISELRKRVDDVASRGLRCYVWTSFAQLTTRYSGNPTAVAAIQKINDYWRAQAALPGATFKLIEIANGYDNATMTLGGSDNTHPNDTGKAYMATKQRPIIQIGA